MMVQPSEENIKRLIEVTDADRHTAYSFLKGNCNDVEQAVDAFFTNPDPKRYDNAVKWDEGAFSADRHGGNDLKVVNPAFDAGETVGGVAPSRPPSRAQQARSQIEQEPPTYGRVDPGWGAQKPSEDFEGVDEAIQRSLQDQGSNGIKRDLVGREIVPDVDAPARERQREEPVFLKPFVSGDFLPALFVILHNIPSCRNHLLSSNRYLDDYGHNDSWWMGEAIRGPSLVYNSENTSGDDQSTTTPIPQMVAETQRLMAFLDESERSYGSAEVLAHIQDVATNGASDLATASALQKFLVTWDKIFPEDPLFKLSVTNVSEESTTTDLSLLHIHNSSHTIHLPPNASSFSDVLGNTLWEKRPDGQFDFDHFLAVLPNVLVVDMCQHHGQSIDISPTLNLGRYMESNRSAIETIRSNNIVHIEEVNRIDNILAKINPINGNGKQVAAGKAIGERQDAIAALQTTLQYLTDRRDSQGSRADGVRNGEVIRELEKARVTIQARIDSLITDRNTAQSSMQPISDFLAESDNPEAARDPQGSCSHYLLRGIATSATQHFEVYLPAPSISSPAGLPRRWWRISYDTRQTTPDITKQLVNESQVLAIATKGLHRTLLVYANAKHLARTERLPLPQALHDFVALDNATFRDELNAAAIVPIVLDAEAMQGVTTSSSATLGRGGSRRGSSGSSTKVELSDGEDDVPMGDDKGGADTPTSQNSATLMDLRSDGLAPPAETQEMQQVSGSGFMGMGRGKGG